MTVMSLNIFPTLGFPVIARDNKLKNPIITPNAPNTAAEVGNAAGTTGNDLILYKLPEIKSKSNCILINLVAT